MIAAYLRVSSGSQDAATQRATIEQAAKARGLRIGRWYSEKRSGKSLRRPELDRLIADAIAGELQAVFVFRLDRFTRRGARDLLTTIETLHDAGVEIRNVRDGYSCDGPAWRIVVGVLGGVAEMEGEANAARLAEARARVEREGGHWGRPRRVGPADERRIHELARKRLNAGQIAAELGIGERTIRNVLGKKGPYGRTAKAPRKRG